MNNVRGFGFVVMKHLWVGFLLALSVGCNTFRDVNEAPVDTTSTDNGVADTSPDVGGQDTSRDDTAVLTDTSTDEGMDTEPLDTTVEMDTSPGCTSGADCSTDKPVCSQGVCQGVKALARGQTDDFMCAVTDDGAVWCWGNNLTLSGVPCGQLGLDPAETPPTKRTPAPVPGLENVATVGVGFSYVCARTEAGEVWCWGDNTYGQLGRGTMGACAYQPMKVPGLSGVVELATGSSSNCALLDTGRVLCWGHNEAGKLGDGTTTNQPSPTEVPGLSDASEIWVGTTHACARHGSPPQVSCWGANGTNQIDSTSTDPVMQPVKVDDLTDALKIGLGAAVTCGLFSTGEVKCRGFNFHGLAVPSLAPDNVVTLSAVGSGYTDVRPGWVHSCALMSGGQVQCWGWNRFGQFGSASTGEDKAPPTTVVSPNGSGTFDDVVLLATHRQFTCAKVADGTLYCWGNNEKGQLGIGTILPALAPTAVTW